MALKRKRSSIFGTPSSPANSDPTTTNTFQFQHQYHDRLPLFFPQSKPLDAARLQNCHWTDQKVTFPAAAQSATVEAQHGRDGAGGAEGDMGEESRHLNSRTRKRHRDDRPDEAEVYATTMHKLFAAQNQHLDETLPPAHCPQDQQQAQPHPPPQKSTLHSFWNIGSKPPSSSHTSTTALPRPARGAAGTSSSSSSSTHICEDCDTPLLGRSIQAALPPGAAAAMEVDNADTSMDIDVETELQELACTTCARVICDRCAIVSYERRCLGCATSGWY